MFLPRIQFVRDEGSARLTQDPFLRHGVGFGVVAYLHAGGQVVDVLHKVVVEKGDTAFDGVGHLGSVGEVGEEQVRESGFVPDVLGAVEGMPFGAHQVAHSFVNVLDYGDLWQEMAEAACPRSEGKGGECQRCSKGWDFGNKLLGNLCSIMARPGFELSLCGKVGFLQLLDPLGVIKFLVSPSSVWFAEVVSEEYVVASENFIRPLAYIWRNDQQSGFCSRYLRGLTTHDCLYATFPGKLRQGMLSDETKIEMGLLVKPYGFFEIGGKLCLIHMYFLKIDTKKVGRVLGDDCSRQHAYKNGPGVHT